MRLEVFVTREARSGRPSSVPLHACAQRGALTPVGTAARPIGSPELGACDVRRAEISAVGAVDLHPLRRAVHEAAAGVQRMRELVCQLTAADPPVRTEMNGVRLAAEGATTASFAERIALTRPHSHGGHRG